MWFTCLFCNKQFAANVSKGGLYSSTGKTTRKYCSKDCCTKQLAQKRHARVFYSGVLARKVL